MSERLTPNHSEHEHSPDANELEHLAHKSELSKEKLAEESDRAKKAEQQAEAKIEKLSKAEKKEKPTHHPEQAEKEPRGRITRREQQQAFSSELKEIQQHLKPTARAFSKFVHNPAVESVSQVLEETVFRPSFLTGGAIGALIFGGAFYLVAKISGFPLAGSEFIVGILIGGLVGVAVEMVVKFAKRNGKKQP